MCQALVKNSRCGPCSRKLTVGLALRTSVWAGDCAVTTSMLLTSCGQRDTPPQEPLPGPVRAGTADPLQPPQELVLKGEVATVRVMGGDLRDRCPLHLGDQKDIEEQW